MVDGSCWGRRLFLLFLAISGQLVIGPRPPHGPRDRSDLILGRVTAQTASVRTKLLNDFEAWLAETASWTQSLSALARQDPIWATELLEEYGMVLYDRAAAGETLQKRSTSVNRNARISRLCWRVHGK